MFINYLILVYKAKLKLCIHFFTTHAYLYFIQNRFIHVSKKWRKYHACTPKCYECLERNSKITCFLLCMNLISAFKIGCLWISVKPYNFIHELILNFRKLSFLHRKRWIHRNRSYSSQTILHLYFNKTF